ncbi:septation ring formation regulator EzrA [Vagococcus humatus]|uniref:Septation ring formation regulator EzrA n=1 Tax=Vagococcus humatus TaxID=1889241 RepID=A0A429Z769_9ENTE|nr:septation ring formation regulator EzrA [Vagococcus humatus]RST89537.1 septation ring formation regulator EzrA [Vagococcus humatus]
MQSNTILWIFLAIIVVAAILYLVATIMKKKNNDKLSELEKRKIALFDLPVIEEVDEIKKMHLVGQSQNTFREWNQKWTELSTDSFAELESRIFEVENLNETFRFFKVNNAVEEAYATMDEMETEVEKIRAGLKELRESEERNSLAVQESLDRYEEIAHMVKEHPDKFGPSIRELNKRVKKVEDEFTQFVALNTAGDPMEARTILDKAEASTKELEETIQAIPHLFEDLNQVFPDQLKEIRQGYDTLLKQSYNFPDQSIPTDIEKVQDKLKKALAYLEKCEVEAVTEENDLLANLIDSLYGRMEKEIQGKAYVTENMKVIQDYIQHVRRNNRQLMIEIDHISQSYALNRNELGLSRGFQTQLEELEKEVLKTEEKVNKHETIYSRVESFLKNCFDILKEIENQQIQMSDFLNHLRTGEKLAQEKIDNFDFELRNMKRYVDKQRLPGIPADYLEFFFVATRRVEDLSKELNRIRIDMDQINQLVSYCEEDIDILEQKTNELVDSAALTEQMLQYANRYRHSHQEIEEAINQSLYLFSKEYRYKDALDEIGATLEKVEPGAFKRIEAFYMNHKENLTNYKQ